MIDLKTVEMIPLNEFICEYKDINIENKYRPVAVGKYGIRARDSIYSKELAKDYSKNKLIYKDTLTVGMGSSQIDIGILVDDVVYSVSPAYHTYKIRNINSAYLNYCLKCRNIDMFNQFVKRGSRQGKSIDLKRWLTYQIPVYDAKTQSEIVRILDEALKLVELRSRQLEQLDELVKARFVEMFGDPETNPMGWLKETLCNHLNVVGGYAFKSELFVEEGIPVLRIGNINAGFFQPINMVYWKHDDNLSRYMMYAGDLVMSLTGTVGKDDYGNVCILGDDYDCYYLNQRNAKLELFKSLDKYYLSQILKFSAIKKKLTGISRGVRQANISNKDILNLEIPIPPIELQNEFATFVEQTDKSKVVVQKALDEAQTLFDSLMQKYFG